MLYTYPLPAAYAASPDNHEKNGLQALMFSAVRNYKSQLHMLSEEEVDAQCWKLGRLPIRYTVNYQVDATTAYLSVIITHQLIGALI